MKFITGDMIASAWYVDQRLHVVLRSYSDVSIEVVDTLCHNVVYEGLDASNFVLCEDGASVTPCCDNEQTKPR